MTVAHYVNVSPAPLPLASGRVLGLGESAELDVSATGDPHDRALHDDGLLLKMNPQPKASKKESD